jgi:maleylacetate reductase
MLQSTFVYSPLPARVVFGAGSLDQLAHEVAELGCARALVICTPEQLALARTVAEILGAQCAGIFPEAVMHVPIEVARRARELARDIGADCIVATGGGSTIGLGKAIALESSLPIIAVPTTYAGSEMTPIYGITADNQKQTGRDVRVLPRTVLYDPALTVSLPPRMSATSGLNAIAHCVEAMYAENGNPITSLMALEGIRSFASGLPQVLAEPKSLDARSLCLYGAWLAGSVLGATSVALHHKLCHTLGGMLNLPHADTHAVVLPHALAYNAPAVPAVAARIAAALDVGDAAQGLYDLTQCLDVPVSLRALGVAESELDRVADAALLAPYPNPRELTRDGVRALLQDAWSGQRPDHTSQ